LRAIREDCQAWQLVITDQDLPNMSGLDLAREIQAINPALPVILHTGVADAVSEQQAREQGIAELLRKPATPAELAARVRAVLDRSMAATAASDLR
jgi:two-component system cell cycle sensor histidine kinase/response regulator CckA